MKLKQVSGSALLEMMLVLPIFLLLISGVIETSAMLYDRTIISDASREGARYGIVVRNGSYATSSQVIAYTQQYCANHLITFASPSPPVTVTLTSSASSPALGDTLTVNVSYQYTGLLLYRLISIGQTVTLNATTKMAYE